MAIPISNALNGSTTFNSNLRCEGVINGAFFSQSDLEVPKKVMTKHAGQNMVMPSRKFANLALIHSQLGLCLLEALLHGPFFLAADICKALCTPLGIQPPLYRRRVAFYAKDR
jgi:hypothetical protein